MNNVIHLEINKINKKKLILSASIMLIFVVILTSIVLFGINRDEGFAAFVNNMDLPINEQAEWAVITGTMGPMFITVLGLLFEGYLIGEIIINEFRQKTIYQLFTYPYKRSTIIYAKILIIFTLSFAFHATSTFLFLILIKLLTLIMGVSYHFTLTTLLNILIQAILLSILGLLPVTIGLIKQSNIMTYITALLLAQIFGNSFILQVRGASATTYLPLLIVALAVIISLCITVTRINHIDIY